MSDVMPPYAPPPPPPPPTVPPAMPPSVPPTNSYDILRPFTYVFDDPRWLPKVLIGGLFIIASIFLVGIFFVLGYVARVGRNIVAGLETPLPEWDDLGSYFSEGLRLFCAGLVYVLPVLVLAMFFIVPMAITGHAESEVVRNVGGGIGLMFGCLMVPISLGLAIWLPAALTMAIVSQEFGAAFQFGRIARFIRANIANYLIAIVVYFVARFAAGFGIILCFIGVVFTGFWSALVAAHAFAQVHRLSSEK